MRIIHFTNTYTPVTGGVERSLNTLVDGLEDKGHACFLVAPEFKGYAKSTDRILRVPALKEFNDSAFSVRLPVPGLIDRFVKKIKPDLIHSHHPFLLGDAALRMASKHKLPLIFTHHTLYEKYVHYLPVDPDKAGKLAVQVPTDYANFCDAVIAPSRTIRDLLLDRGVQSPVWEIPTGVDCEQFGSGDRAGFRREHDLPEDALVIGHLGRLAEEKNLTYLARAVSGAMKDLSEARFLCVGDGDAGDAIREAFDSAGCVDRLVMPGRLTGQAAVDAYAAMDLFAFASQSETQGLVLVEAMAAGNPVVALDAPGAREAVTHDDAGLLLPGDASVEDFAHTLVRMAEDLDPTDTNGCWQTRARDRAHTFNVPAFVEKVLGAYHEAHAQRTQLPPTDRWGQWEDARNRLSTEWQILTRKASAAWDALKPDG
ncbi:MAG: glycosyltransferase [Opitutales bacterium]